ncbi:YbaB/EbfC family nucleoid-associated protein [Actinopolymorpha sp. B11F2]|uniref:YbaB/EbfC family nucleoid-associated protein n=1 Tax=Actinopolymorpha sp. B11F2 TaxID=3160862 RepID=UPI0032E42BCF
MSGTGDLSATAIDQLLTDTRRALETMRSGQQVGEPAEPIIGEGEASDGKVHAVVALPGEVQSLTMDPRLMREGSESVCDAVVEAVNAALADLRAKATTEVGGSVDLEQLSGDLEAVQNESLQTMKTMFGALQEVMDRIDRRT